MNKTKLNSSMNNFRSKSFALVHKKKTGHSLELSISIFVSFNGVFLTLKWETLVLKTTAWGEDSLTALAPCFILS